MLDTCMTEPLYEPWREAMEEHRRKLDEDPDAL